MIIILVFFFVAVRKKADGADRAQNVAEATVDFVVDGIILQTIGPDGMSFLPFLLSLFLFIFITNIFEIIPFIQFPANARMANPLVLALIVWVVFLTVGYQGAGLSGLHARSTLFPPGVPKALYVLVTPIEFLSTFLVRPFSLAVRLFANMLAGHLLLVTFALLTDTLLFHNIHRDPEADRRPSRGHGHRPHRLRGAGRRCCKRSSSPF